MARSPRSTASKSRSGAKGRGRTASKTATASKKSRSKGATPRKANPSSAASKGRAARPQSRRRQLEAGDVASSVGKLLTSQVGREILAEILEAAVSVLRRARDTGRQIAASGETAAGGASSTMSTAVDVSTDVASGAIKAGGEIAGAAADMVRGATETLVNVATGAARELSPDKGHKRSKDG